MAWSLTYKGLTAVPGSFTGIDETAKTITQLIADIKSDETGGAASTTIDGPDSLSYGDCYDRFYVSRDTSIELTDLTGSDTIDQHLVDGDEIICTPKDGTGSAANKRVRQQVKLGIAQIKRKALMSDNPTTENYYRTNNTYEWDNLPAVFNTDGTVLDTATGMVVQRPWNTALGVAGVDISGLTLSAGLVEREYTVDYFGDKSDPYDDQTAYDNFFGGSPAINDENVVNNISRDGTVAETTTYTLLGYFKPDSTGTWGFRIRSDDASYLFLGDSAEVNDNDAPTNITLANAVVDNGEKHGAQDASGNFYLEADSYYYLYAIFGNDGGPGTAEFYFTAPGESENQDGPGGVGSDFSGLIFYNTATDGQ